MDQGQIDTDIELDSHQIFYEFHVMNPSISLYFSIKYFICSTLLYI